MQPDTRTLVTRAALLLAALLFLLGSSSSNCSNSSSGPSGSTKSSGSSGPKGSIQTTLEDGTAVNWNIYPTTADVYLNGGPQNQNATGLADGFYYFQVTDPSGKTLLSTDNAVCRQLRVIDGRVSGAVGPCPHPEGTFNSASGGVPVQLAPFSATPNEGGVYKAWVVPVGDATIGDDDIELVFARRDAKTDNFKVQDSMPPPPVGSCQPSSSLSAMTSGTDVVSYVPKGSWLGGGTGIAVVNVEGAAVLPTTNPIPTADVINSCASNSVTGETVCTANNNQVYRISGLAAVPTVTTLASAGVGFLGFSGGSCTNCGVVMDAIHNKAVIGLALGGGTGGFQFLDLGTSTLEPAFASMVASSDPISEDPLIDPIRNLLLNATESNDYEVIDVATSTSPSFFENSVSISGLLDSSGADCETGIILAPAEFSAPSQVYIANLSSTSTLFTPGAPGSWSAPSQSQVLSESFLAAGASGIAVAQGTHLGVVTGEFGGDALTAISLPTAIDTSAAVPAIQDWVTCRIGGGFNNGLDPHTVTAYQSPSAPNHAIALLANSGATLLAVVDVTDMLDTTIVPRTGGGHGCAAGFLPASVVSLMPVP